MIALALPDPYLFVCLITGALAWTWTVMGILRLRRFLARWEGRFERFGLDPAWVRRAALIGVARVTVLDPINLALMLALLLIWSVRATL